MAVISVLGLLVQPEQLDNQISLFREQKQQGRADAIELCREIADQARFYSAPPAPTSTSPPTLTKRQETLIAMLCKVIVETPLLFEEIERLMPPVIQPLLMLGFALLCSKMPTDVTILRALLLEKPGRNPLVAYHRWLLRTTKQTSETFATNEVGVENSWPNPVPANSDIADVVVWLHRLVKELAALTSPLSVNVTAMICQLSFELGEYQFRKDDFAKALLFWTDAMQLRQQLPVDDIDAYICTVTSYQLESAVLNCHVLLKHQDPPPSDRSRVQHLAEQNNWEGLADLVAKSRDKLHHTRELLGMPPPFWNSVRMMSLQQTNQNPPALIQGRLPAALRLSLMIIDAFQSTPMLDPLTMRQIELLLSRQIVSFDQFISMVQQIVRESSKVILLLSASSYFSRQNDADDTIGAAIRIDQPIDAELAELRENPQKALPYLAQSIETGEGDLGALLLLVDNMAAPSRSAAAVGWWGHVDISAAILRYIIVSNTTPSLIESTFQQMMHMVTSPRPFGARMLPSQWLYWLPALSIELLRQRRMTVVAHISKVVQNIQEPSSHWWGDHMPPPEVEQIERSAERALATWLALQNTLADAVETLKSRALPNSLLLSSFMDWIDAWTAYLATWVQLRPSSLPSHPILRYPSSRLETEFFQSHHQSGYSMAPVIEVSVFSGTAQIMGAWNQAASTNNIQLLDWLLWSIVHVVSRVQTSSQTPSSEQIDLRLCYDWMGRVEALHGPTSGLDRISLPVMPSRTIDVAIPVNLLQALLLRKQRQQQSIDDVLVWRITMAESLHVVPETRAYSLRLLLQSTIQVILDGELASLYKPPARLPSLLINRLISSLRLNGEYLHAALWWQWSAATDTDAAASDVIAAIATGQCYSGRDEPLTSTIPVAQSSSNKPSDYLSFAWEPSLLEWMAYHSQLRGQHALVPTISRLISESEMIVYPSSSRKEPHSTTLLWRYCHRLQNSRLFASS